MSSVNVLPSAPPQNIYPPLETTNSPQDFRLTKVNEIDHALAQEVGHYRLVAKKYKLAKRIVDFCAGSSGLLSTGFSSASFGSTLSGIGILTAVLLGAVASICGFTSAALVVASKKLEPKVRKHLEILTLTLAKRECESAAFESFGR